MTMLDGLIAAVKITRDLQLIALGVVVAMHTPPSLREAGLYGPLSIVWALMILVGAVVAAAGTAVRSVALEGIGCLAVGVGFAVWAIGALQQPAPTSVTYAVTLLLGAGVSGQFVRALTAVRDEDLRP